MENTSKRGNSSKTNRKLKHTINGRGKENLSCMRANLNNPAGKIKVIINQYITLNIKHEVTK